MGGRVEQETRLITQNNPTIHAQAYASEAKPGTGGGLGAAKKRGVTDGRFPCEFAGVLRVSAWHGGSQTPNRPTRGRTPNSTRKCDKLPPP